MHGETRAWYADGGNLQACAYRQTARGLAEARDRYSIGVHMSSLAARDTWRGWAGGYAMVNVLGIPQFQASRLRPYPAAVPGPLCRVCFSRYVISLDRGSG